MRNRELLKAKGPRWPFINFTGPRWPGTVKTADLGIDIHGFVHHCLRASQLCLVTQLTERDRSDLSGCLDRCRRALHDLVVVIAVAYTVPP
jgi:thiosulfate reductase cytochrome b subunit